MVSGAKKGEQALDGLGKKANQTETQFGKLSKSTSALKGLFASLGIGIAIRQFALIADATTNMDNRIRLVTNSTDELNAVYGELFRISNETRSSLTENANLFNRIAQSTKELGLTYAQQIDFTKRLNQAMIISGESSVTAAGALRQFGQALASGGLRGDEFISVNETLPRVMDAVVDELNRVAGAAKYTKGDLRDLAKEGKLTADLLYRSMTNAGSALDEEFAKITPTIGSAFTVLQNHFVDFIRNVNQASGIGEIFANGILFLANNFNALAGAAAGAALVIGGVMVRSIVAMTVALAANPLGLLVLAVAAAAAALGAFGSSMVTVGGQTASVWQVIKAGFITGYQVISDVVVGASELFQGWMDQIGDFFDRNTQGLVDWANDWGLSVDDISGVVKLGVNFIIGTYVGLFKSIGELISTLPRLWKAALVSAQNLIVAGVEKIVNTFVKGFGLIGDAIDFFSGSDLGGSIRGLSIDLSDARAKGEGLSTVLGDLGSTIGDTFAEAQSGDYLGGMTSAMEELGGPVMDKFNTNLSEVIVNTEKSAALNDLLNNKFKDVTKSTNENTDANKASKKAVDELNKSRQSFIETLNQEYEQYRINNGQAVAVTQEWYAQQLQILDTLGLKYEDHGSKLEAIFGERMKSAYQTDLQNATDWRSGVERAINGFSGGIKTEADLAEAAMTTMFSAAGNALDEFVRTGTLDFKKFAASVLADIGKMILQFMILKAVKLALGIPMAEGGQVGTVKAATGGLLRGPGTGTSDSIPAMLSNGEFVVNAKATKDYLPLLKAINDNDMKMIGLREGGMSNEKSTLRAPASNVQRGPDGERSEEQEGGFAKGNGVRVINVLDKNLLGDYLATSDGERTIINIVKQSGMMNG